MTDEEAANNARKLLRTGVTGTMEVMDRELRLKKDKKLKTLFSGRIPGSFHASGIKACRHCVWELKQGPLLKLEESNTYMDLGSTTLPMG